ncbi:hypothetical protein Afil01_25420 [Actinorhabdospora filicis]|uniref:LPXTG-motif cell wall-anchored protein n=1 Tax=Actinorhabdospora filicis TaxID=1785913 RepID=A0A9W6WAK5_9ACTN|nr:hypothetical protein [Actinorhabdospora filicis]GLZ77735.1 hypothetical protein Afil01_25420 [Actinorhabdospora filicis]
MKHTLHRLGAACALTAFVVGAAAPAYAAEQPRLAVADWNEVSLAPGETAAGGPGLYFDGEGSGTITGLVMTVDIGAAAGLAEITTDDCDRSGTILTCALNDVRYTEGDYPSIDQPHLEFTALTGVNGVAKLPVTIAADNATTTGGTFTVRVAETVEFGYEEVTNPGAPGQTIDVKIPVANGGDTTIYNPVLNMEIDGAAPAGPLPANCVSHLSAGSYRAWLTCRFDAVLKPGASSTLTMPWTIRTDVLRQVYGGFTWEGNDGEAPTGNGTGPALTIPGAPKAPAEVPVQHVFDGASYPGDLITLTSGGKTDLVAVSSTLPAKTGAATLTVAVRNDGPGMLWPGGGGEPMTYVWVKLPKGVTVTSLPDGCAKPNPGDFGKDVFPGDFRCGKTVDIEVGESMSFEIPVQVTAVDLAAEGAVIVARDFGGEPQSHIDSNAGNDRTPIAFEGGNGGGLAQTGTTAGLVAAVGAVALLAGFVAFRAFRRRANTTGYYGPADE